EDAAREELQVHLVADAETRWHDPQAVECLRPPLEEPVALAVAAELHLHIELECLIPAEVVDLDRVIDDEVDGNQRLHSRNVMTAARHRGAHRGEIDEERYAGEVLQQ